MNTTSCFCDTTEAKPEFIVKNMNLTFQILSHAVRLLLSFPFICINHSLCFLSQLLCTADIKQDVWMSSAVCKYLYWVMFASALQHVGFWLKRWRWGLRADFQLCVELFIHSPKSLPIYYVVIHVYCPPFYLSVWILSANLCSINLHYVIKKEKERPQHVHYFVITIP